MSATETPAASADSSAVRLDSCTLDIVEVAALRGRVRDIESIARQRGGLELPALGWFAGAGDSLAICVRPCRWLLLSSAASPGACVAGWQSATSGVGASVDLSSALTACHLSGDATREVLSRGCRLDLDPDVFLVGHAAATIMALVSVILVRLASGMLLLTPSSTARHVREWLASTARPFGLAAPAEIPFASLCGEPKR